MGVAQEDEVQRLYTETESGEILPVRLLPALKQAAIDDETRCRLDQATGPGDLVRGTLKSELHDGFNCDGGEG